MTVQQPLYLLGNIYFALSDPKEGYVASVESHIERDDGFV